MMADTMMNEEAAAQEQETQLALSDQENALEGQVVRQAKLVTPGLPVGLIAAQAQMCKEWVSACFTNHRNSRLAWFDHYGIDPDLVGRCRWADAGVVETAIKYYADRMQFNHAFIICPNDIMRLIEREVEADKLIDQYLAQGASNSLMKDLFKLQSMDLAARRARIGVCSKLGRRCVEKLSEEERIELIETYTEEKRVGEDERRLILRVSTITGVSTEVVYHTLRRSKI